MCITDVQMYLSLQGVEGRENTLVLATVIQESNFLAFSSLVFQPLVFVPDVVFMRPVYALKIKQNSDPLWPEDLPIL